MSDRAGISEGFVYVPKPAAAPAANIRVSLPPHNRDVFDSGNETIMFNIPCGKRGQYLNTRMSYMTFDLDVTVRKEELDKGDFPILKLDGGAHALIQHLELYHGTNLLEQIREYNNLYQLHLDKDEVTDGIAYNRNVSEGTGNFTVTPVVVPQEVLSMCYSKTATHRSESVSVPLHQSTSGANVTTAIAPAYGFGWHTVSKDAQPKRFVHMVRGTGNTETEQVSEPLAFSIAEPYTAQFKPRIQPVDSLDKAWSITNGGAITSSTPQFGMVVDQTVTYTFAIPIMSGIIGGGMGKYIPVGALQSDLRLEIGLSSWSQAFRAYGTIEKTTVNNVNEYYMSTRLGDVFDTSKNFSKHHQFKLRNVELQLEYVEVASDVQSAIEASTGGQYVMSYDSYFNIQNAIPAGSQSFVQLIGAKFSSVKTLLSTFRDSMSQSQFHLSGLSRVNPFSTTPNRPEFYSDELSGGFHTKYTDGGGWYYSIGATHYPPKPVRSDEESYYESLKAAHLIAVQQTPGHITKKMWRRSARRDLPGTDTVSSSSSTVFEHPLPDGKFYLAMNLESQSHKSHLAESGVNTLAQNMYLHCMFPKPSKPLGDTAYPWGLEDAAKKDHTYTAVRPLGLTGTDAPTINAAIWQQNNQSLVVDHYVHYDGLLIIVNGIANTRF